MLYPSIQQKSQRLYRAYLRSLIEGISFFPLPIPFTKLKSSQNYDIIQQNVHQLMQHAGTGGRPGYTVVLKKTAHRKYGTQSFPDRIFFEAEQDFLHFLGKHQEAIRFKKDMDLIGRFSALKLWALKNVMKIPEHHGVWLDLLKVVDYFLKHPSPDLYVRELPIKVHTKFIETHQRVLKSMLDVVLPPEHARSWESSFERRYGLKYDEELMRFRFLDGLCSNDFPVSDFSLPVSQMHKVPACTLVFVVENKMNFLTFPAVKGSVVIWGKGFSVAYLQRIPWLKKARIFYWGDIDAQGFQILAMARTLLPQTHSMLMDRATLDQYASCCVSGHPSPVKEFPCLTKEEQAVAQYVNQHNLRLEQEKISQQDVIKILQSFAP